jgi:hypothetical protein
MLRKILFAGATLAVMAGPALAASGSGNDTDYYLVKSARNGTCTVSTDQASGSDMTVGGIYSSHAAADQALQTSTECHEGMASLGRRPNTGTY